MKSSNVTMLSQQSFSNQFQVGEILIPNMQAFNDRNAFLEFLQQANRIPRIAGIYEFRVSRLHGPLHKEGDAVVYFPGAPMYIEIEGSDVRFSERLFLRKQ